MIIASGWLPWMAVAFAAIAAVIPAVLLIIERPMRATSRTTTSQIQPPPPVPAPWTSAPAAESRAAGSPAAPVLLMGSAVLAIIGSLVTWASLRVQGSPRPRASRFGNQFGSGHLRQSGLSATRSVQGISTSEGKLALALGLALLVAALVILTTTLPSVRVAFAGLGLTFGVGLAVLGAATWGRPLSLFGSFGPGEALRRGAVATVGAGLYFVMAGALLSLIAGVAALVAARS
jgi:hypothetical protein